MFQLKKLFKNESKDCCEVKIEEVKDSTKSEELTSACCSLEIEKMKDNK